jgi:hypothetical protein
MAAVFESPEEAGMAMHKFAKPAEAFGKPDVTLSIEQSG